MKSLIEVLRLSTQYLESHGIENSRHEAEILLSDLLQLKRMQLYLEHDRPLEDAEVQSLRERIKRRAKHEPAAYIHGAVQFYSCQIKISSAVLIPRQETEILTDLIAKELQEKNLEGKKLLDLCSGSGCIGLSLKKRFHELDVTLSDLSSDALSLAKENAHLNQLDVSFVQGDLLDPFDGQSFDYVVCNPPYISQEEYDHLSPDVRDFEPKGALLSGITGYEIFDRLQIDLPQVMQQNGQAWLEIGSTQGPHVASKFLPPFWISTKILKDWAGHDRFIALKT